MTDRLSEEAWGRYRFSSGPGIPRASETGEPYTDEHMAFLAGYSAAQLTDKAILERAAEIVERGDKHLTLKARVIHAPSGGSVADHLRGEADRLDAEERRRVKARIEKLEAMHKVVE